LAFGKKNNTPQHPQIFTDLIGLSRIICENPFSFVPISGYDCPNNQKRPKPDTFGQVIDYPDLMLHLGCYEQEKNS
jgi:hypothetical protein